MTKNPCRLQIVTVALSKAKKNAVTASNREKNALQESNMSPSNSTIKDFKKVDTEGLPGANHQFYNKKAGFLPKEKKKHHKSKAVVEQVTSVY